MNKKELEKELEKGIKKQKERAKKAIDDCNRFIVFTYDDVIGCASAPELCTILSLGLRSLISEGMVPKQIMKSIFDLVLADDPNKHMEETIKELNKESEE